MDTIIYIGGFKLPAGNAAGIRVLNNAKILRDLGYKVVFIDVSENIDKNVLKNCKIVDGFECYSKKYPHGAEWANYLMSVKDFKKVFSLYNNVKAVIAYNYQAGAFLKLKKFCKKHNLKLYADCTEWYGKTNFIKDIDTALRMEYIQKRIDGVIAISRFLYDYYKTFVNTVLIPPLNDCDEEKYNIDSYKNENLSFSYAGSPGRDKDKLNMIIEALNSLDIQKKYEFNIIGITKKQYVEFYPEHKEIIEKMKENLKFHGRILREEVLEILKTSDFSVFFRPDTIVSRAGFPTKYSEAVTCGIPMITNLTSNIGDYLKDGVNGIVIAGFSCEDIKNAFERAFSLSKDELENIKVYCRKNNRVFHYKNFENEMQRLIR